MWPVLPRGSEWNSTLIDAFCPKEVIEKDGVTAVDSADELYSTCNVVSLHIPATAETKEFHQLMICWPMMPKGGVSGKHSPQRGDQRRQN